MIRRLAPELRFHQVGAGHQAVLVMGGDIAGKGVSIQLLDAQRNAFLVHVDRQHHGLDFVALLEVLLGLFAADRPG